MARYIDAEHLFKCETCRHHRSGGCDTWCENGECYSPDMSKIPTADVKKVKHGKWIYNVKYYSCSICAGNRFNLLLGTDAEFCPYCGAKMEINEREEN